jgi:hypothetical protein
MSLPTAISGTRRQVRELVDGTLEVKIHVEPRHKADFHALFPEIDSPVALAPLNTATAQASLKSETEDSAGAPTEPSAPAAAAANYLASHLHVIGFFRNPKLWAAMDAAGIYTENQHQAYIEAQPCVGWGTLECSGDVCLHHVKSAANSGVGHKPPAFYGVSLCFNHHRNWAHGTGAHCATRQDKQDLLERAVAITAENVREVIKRHLKIESLRLLTLEMLHKFESDIGLPLTQWEEI